MNTPKITYFSRIPNKFILVAFIVENTLLSGNLKSQVSNLPVCKLKDETTGNIQEFSSNSVFEYTSSQKPTIKPISIQNVENTHTKKNYDYSVSESKRGNDKIQSKMDFYNITSKFSNNKEYQSSANFNQAVFASKTNSSSTNTEQQIPFQELNKTDNQQTMQKSGPSGNPGDPGIIPVGDGTLLLLLALGCYTIIKFKNL
ncbi:MAG: hypothetical protein WCG93_05220 [Paludibacter sp.]